MYLLNLDEIFRDCCPKRVLLDKHRVFFKMSNCMEVMNQSITRFLPINFDWPLCPLC